MFMLQGPRSNCLSTRRRGPAGLPKDFEVPGHESHGRQHSCADVPQDAHAGSPNWTLHPALLRPGQPGPIRLPLPCWRPRILTTQRGH